MPFKTNKLNRSIEDYLDEVNKKYSYPVWQREDCWYLYFKKDLIVYVLNGIDIPKLYIIKNKR